MSFSELSEVVRTITGITSASHIFIIVIGFVALYILIKKEINLSYAMSLEKYKSEQQHFYAQSLEKYKREQQQYLSLLLIDENAKMSVISNTIAIGDKEKIRIYKRVYELYLKVIRSRGTIKIRDDKYNELFNEIDDVKKDIRVNYIYLGELIDPLFNAVIGLPDDLAAVVAGNVRYEHYDSEKTYDELLKAEKWIRDNIQPYLTLNNIDLPVNTRDKIREEMDKMAKKQLENAPNNN